MSLLALEKNETISFFQDEFNKSFNQNVSSNFEQLESFKNYYIKDLGDEVPKENAFSPRNEIENYSDNFNTNVTDGYRSISEFILNNNYKNIEREILFHQKIDKIILEDNNKKFYTNFDTSEIFHIKVQEAETKSENHFVVIEKTIEVKFLPKKKINDKKPRKLQADCFRKKCKTNHFKAISELIKRFSGSTNLVKFKASIVNDITIRLNKQLYSQTILNFLKENDYIFANDKKKYEMLINNQWFLENFGLYSIFDFLEKFYYNKNTDFQKIFEIHDEFLENNRKEESQEYYLLLKHYNSNFLKYYKEENANKKRSDEGILKPRKYNK